MNEIIIEKDGLRVTLRGEVNQPAINAVVDMLHSEKPLTVGCVINGAGIELTMERSERSRSFADCALISGPTIAIV